MENNIKKALTDIGTIKKILLEDSNIKKFILNVSIYLGVINILWLLTDVTVALFIPLSQPLIYFYLTASIILYLVTFIYFLYLYKKCSLKKYKNILYLYFLLIIVNIIMPIISKFAPIILVTENTSNIIIQIDMLNKLFNILVLSFFMFVSSSFFNKVSIRISFIIGSFIIFLVNFITCIFYPINSISFNSSSGICISALVYYISMAIGYILIFILIKRENIKNEF